VFVWLGLFRALQEEAKSALLALHKNSKTYHLPNGNFTGAKRVFKPEATDVTPLTVEPDLEAQVILFHFADETTDPVPGVTYDSLDPDSLPLFKDYATYTSSANGDNSMGELLLDALNAADKKVDFSKIADVGSTLDNVFFVHDGTGAEWSGTPDLIRSHSWDCASAYCYSMFAQTKDISWLETGEKYNFAKTQFVFDGVYVDPYSIEPEVGGDLTGYAGAKSGPFPPEVGVYAHEFSHVMGVPDEYDYGYESEGTGIYSLKSSGSWTRWPNAVQYSGNTPVMLDAWGKYYLGFANLKANITTHIASDPVTLRPSSEYNDMIRIVVPGTNGKEYFLVENRQQIGFDQGLDRGASGDGIYGVAIYHIDDNVLARNFWRADEAPAISQKTQWNMSVDKANGEWHYGISILQADGQWDLERGTTYYGPNDLYKAGQSFTPKTYPASSSRSSHRTRTAASSSRPASNSARPEWPMKRATRERTARKGRPFLFTGRRPRAMMLR